MRLSIANTGLRYTHNVLVDYCCTFYWGSALCKKKKADTYEAGPGDIVELVNMQANYRDLQSSNQRRGDALSPVRCRVWASRHSSFGENTNPLSTLSGPHQVPTPWLILSK